MLLAVDMKQPFPRKSSFWGPRRPLVLACGCFDILTVGHVRHLNAAKQLGQTLIVLITDDGHVNKGPGRPVFPVNHRLEVVDALRCVDFTVLNPYPTAMEAILCFSPDVYVKGKEYKHNVTHGLTAEYNAVHEIRGKLEFTDTEELHTTDVVKAIQEACR